MSDEEPPPLQPTAGQLGVAEGLRTMHTRADERPDCAWCFRAWPCPDRAWADRIVRLAAANGVRP